MCVPKGRPGRPRCQGMMPIVDRFQPPLDGPLPVSRDRDTARPDLRHFILARYGIESNIGRPPESLEAIMAVNPIPAGHGTVTPSIIVKGAAKAIDWYKKALGAEEVSRFEGPDGRIMHAEIKIGDSHIMMGDEMPDH